MKLAKVYAVAHGALSQRGASAVNDEPPESPCSNSGGGRSAGLAPAGSLKTAPSGGGMKQSVGLNVKHLVAAMLLLEAR